MGRFLSSCIGLQCSLNRIGESFGRPSRRYWGGQANNGGGVAHSLWKPAAFTLVVGGVAFTLSGIYVAENSRRYLQTMMHIYREDNDKDSLPLKLRRWWWELGPTYRFIAGVVGVNGLVLLGWKYAAWSGRGSQVMTKLFVTGVQNKGVSHMVLSNFSHVEVWHFGINMLAFSSFASGVMYVLGDTVCCAKSLAFLTTAGTFSAMAGYYSKWYRGSNRGSLGASGALYAVVTLVILSNPQSSVYFILLPFVPIKAILALSGLIALDVVGVIRGWQLFDHAAHLGGAFFGLLYKQWLYKVCEHVHAKSASTWAKWRRAKK